MKYKLPKAPKEGAVTNNYGKTNVTYEITDTQTEKNFNRETAFERSIETTAGLKPILCHYGNRPIQIYWKFHHQKLKIFR